MKKLIPNIITFTLVVLLLATAQECARQGSRADINLEALTDTVRHYTNAIGTQSASIKMLQLDKKELRDIVIRKDAELLALSKEFSVVHSVVKAKTVVRIDSIPVPYAIPIAYDFKRSGTIKDKFYSFGYTSTQDGFTIDSMNIPATLYVITGTKRKWFLGKETVTTDISSDNPNLKINDIRSAEVVMPTPWYRKWYLWLAAGIAGGFIMAK